MSKKPKDKKHVNPDTGDDIDPASESVGQPLTDVRLYLCGKPLDPAQVSLILGTEGSHMRATTERSVTSTGKVMAAKIGMWELEAEADSDSLSDQIVWLRDKLSAAKCAPEDIPGVEHSEINVFVCLSEEEEDKSYFTEFSKEDFRWLSNFRLNLTFDLAVVEDPHRGDVIDPADKSGRWPGKKGAEEWGRRNGCGAEEGRRRFHVIVKRDKMGKLKAKNSVNLGTGNDIDPTDESVGQPLVDVKLLLHGKLLDPSQISLMLGTQGSEMHVTGEKWLTSTGKELTAKIGMWALKAKAESNSLSDQIAWFRDKLSAAKCAPEDIPGVESATLSVFVCWILGEEVSDYGSEFTTEDLQWLSDLGLKSTLRVTYREP